MAAFHIYILLLGPSSISSQNKNRNMGHKERPWVIKGKGAPGVKYGSYFLDSCFLWAPKR